MCWENIDEAGTFDATKAADIAFELCHFIADIGEITLLTEAEIRGAF